MPLRNLCKGKQVAIACSLVYPLFILHSVAACLLLYPSFILTLLLYFSLFVDHAKKLIIFVFGAFVYHFKNTILKNGVIVVLHTYIIVHYNLSVRITA